MTARNRNELWAGVLVDELVRCGVRDVIVAPGSRSTPVVLAAARREELRLVVQIDERSAGFLALGVGKATGRPAAVVTTSGTAAANLFPSVVESAWAETPLLVLTADRPPRLRGADANQAIDQVHLFGHYPRWFRELGPAEASEAALRELRASVSRAVSASAGDPAGPVHLNLPFEKPLEPTPVPGDVPEGLAAAAPLAVHGRPRGAPFVDIGRRRAGPDRPSIESLRRRLAAARRPLVVAGPVPRPWETGPAVRGFAAARGIPLLADPLSGARYARGPEDRDFVVVGGYDAALRSAAVGDRLRPDLVLRVGAGPTSARLLDWLAAMADVPQLVIDGGGRWKDHRAVASACLPVDPALLFEALDGEARGGDRHGPQGPPDAGTALRGGAPGRDASAVDPAWLAAWRRVEEAVRDAVGREVSASDGLEGAALARVAEHVAPDELLFVSSSMPVRDLDAFVPFRPGGAGLPGDAGRPSDAGPVVLGNRGASGIDGIVSTAAGASLATGRRVVALVGDLALLHDGNGLSALREPGVRVLLAVVNNDGGGIFHLLPIRDHEPAFTPYFATPHGREPARLAALHDLPHRRADLRGEWRSESDGGEGERGAELAETLDRALTWAFGLEGSGILELRTDREENRRLREAALARVARAAEDALPPASDPPAPHADRTGDEAAAPGALPPESRTSIDHTHPRTT